MTKAQQILRHARIGLEANDGAAAPALQRRLEQEDQILGLLLDLDLAVADHAEIAEPGHLEAGEEPVEIHADQGLQRQEADRLARQADEAGDLGRQDDEGAELALVLGPAQIEHDGEAEIGDEGKGMGRIDGHRRQDREDLVEEEGVEPLLLLGRQLAGIDDGDAAGAHLVAQPAPAGLLIAHELARQRVDGGELLGGAEAVLARGVDPRGLLAFEAGHAHHVEFVEVVGRDGEEAHAARAADG